MKKTPSKCYIRLKFDNPNDYLYKKYVDIFIENHTV